MGYCALCLIDSTEKHGPQVIIIHLIACFKLLMGDNSSLKSKYIVFQSSHFNAKHDLICFELYFSKIKRHKSDFCIPQRICQTHPPGQDERKNVMFQNNWNQQRSVKSLTIK